MVTAASIPVPAAHDAVIVAARRTPLGRRAGTLSTVHPHRLLAAVQDAVLAEAGLAPDLVELVVTGCVTQLGSQAYNIARMAALASGMPAHVPGITLDAQCGSSHEAVHVAAAMVRSGECDVVLASGVESMSTVPLGSAQQAEFGTPYTADYLARFEHVHQGESAERIADAWGITREACDAWATLSQNRAAAASTAGRFQAEIVAIEVDGMSVSRDEGIRDTTTGSLARLRPAFRDDGRHTAGNSSQISDGAAAVLVMSRAKADALGRRPLARVAGHRFVGVDPVLKLTGPITATRMLLDRMGLDVADIDMFEVSEAFAAVVEAWFAEIGAPRDRVNVNGGAIALGHPVGASGARMITTAVHELTRRPVPASAVVTMCCGGGLGTATLLVSDA